MCVKIINMRVLLLQRLRDKKNCTELLADYNEIETIGTFGPLSFTVLDLTAFAF